MSLLTTYTCDRCGHTQDTSDLKFENGRPVKGSRQMWTIAIGYRSGVHSAQSFAPGNYGTSHSTPLTANWCRECMEYMHLLGKGIEEKEKPVADPKPGLEDFIREIARSEAEQVVAESR